MIFDNTTQKIALSAWHQSDKFTKSKWLSLNSGPIKNRVVQMKTRRLKVQVRK